MNEKASSKLLKEIYESRYGSFKSSHYWLNLEELAIELFELLPPKLRRNKKTWGKRYLHSVLSGAYKTPKPLLVAMTNFAAIYLDDASQMIAKLSKKVVYSRNDNLRPGSIILGKSVQCICGAWIVPRSWNGKYCSDDCRNEARRLRRKHQ